MITGTTSSNSNFESQKYIGVAALQVLAVNPDMKKLNELGINVTEEPVYVREYQVDEDPNKTRNYMNLRLLCCIDDLPERPLISLYFKLYPEGRLNGDNTKAQIMDKYANSAWATKDEIKGKKLPEYAKNKMDEDFHIAHRGEAEIMKFMHMYLSIKNYVTWDKNLNEWVKAKNPGHCYIENWKALCNGDITEIEEGFKQRPDNLLRVVLGVRTDDNNKTYQCFIPDDYIYYGAKVIEENGKRVFKGAQKVIDNWQSGDRNQNETYEPTKVRPYNVVPTEVEKNDESKINEIFPESDDDDIDDLPFAKD